MATILVVDDERMICELLGAVLGAHGHQVLTAEDGVEAVTLFRQHRPRLTLLDLRLPKMDGIAVLKQIRMVDPQAPVMILTGAGTDALEKQARALGVTDFLTKGLSMEALVEAVNRAMPQPGRAEAAARPSQDVSQDTSASHRAGNSILVVDDEPMICDLLAQFLTLRGFQVRTARDGLEALEEVKREEPRMIILDMYMPSMSGIEALRRLKAMKYSGRVITLTASQDDKLLQQAKEEGVLDILAKPVDLMKLALKIQVGLTLS
ncbi:MAG: response regulator [Nitrospirae bacterium]|nr:response regulator [Nitrospirota bacterium]